MTTGRLDPHRRRLSPAEYLVPAVLGQRCLGDELHDPPLFPG